MDYAVLMMSDDGYSFLWEQHLDIFFRAWPDFSKPFYICSRTKAYEGKHADRVTPLPVGAEPSWSKRLLLALDAIPQDYVLLTLDDFYLEQAVKTNYVDEALSFITDHEDVAVMYFAPTKTRKQGTENFRCMDHTEPYLLNAQMALWNKKALRSLVRAHETPWEFECYGSRRAAGSPYRFYTWNGDGETVFKYDWGKLVRLHMWDRKQVEKIEACWGITLDLGGVPLYDTYDPPKTRSPLQLAKKVWRRITQTAFHSRWKEPADK